MFGHAHIRALAEDRLGQERPSSPRGARVVVHVDLAEKEKRFPTSSGMLDDPFLRSDSRSLAIIVVSEKKFKGENQQW